MKTMTRNFKIIKTLLGSLTILVAFNNCGPGFDSQAPQDLGVSGSFIQTSQIVRRGEIQGISNGVGLRQDVRTGAGDIVVNWDNPPGVDVARVRLSFRLATSQGVRNESTDNFFQTSDVIQALAPPVGAPGDVTLEGPATTYTIVGADTASLVGFISITDTQGRHSDVVQVDDPLQTQDLDLNPDRILYGRLLAQPFSFVEGIGEPDSIYYFTNLSFCEIPTNNAQGLRAQLEAANLLAGRTSFSDRVRDGRVFKLRGQIGTDACSRVPLPDRTNNEQQQTSQPEAQPEPPTTPTNSQVSNVSQIPRGFYRNPENRDNIVYILQSPLGTFFCSSFEDGSVINNIDGNGTLQSLEGIRAFGKCPANLSNDVAQTPSNQPQTQPQPQPQNPSNSGSQFENGQYVRNGFVGAVLQYDNGRVCRKTQNITGVSEISSDRFEDLVSLSGQAEQGIKDCP